jgi:hypothetical protein
MKILKGIFFVFVLMISIISCDLDRSPLAVTNDSFIEVQFDIQEGFQGKHILMSLDDNKIFEALLSESAPLAGPLASFQFIVRRGLHQIIVDWHQIITPQISNRDSAFISFGEYEKYFIGIAVYQDSLIFRIQNHPFLYL